MLFHIRICYRSGYMQSFHQQNKCSLTIDAVTQIKFTLLFPLFYVHKDTNQRNVVSPIFHLHYKFNQAVWKQFWHFELSYLDIYNTHFLHLMPNSKTFSLPQLLALVYNSSSFLPQTFKHFILICNYLCCRDILYYGYLFKRIYSNSNFHCRILNSKLFSIQKSCFIAKTR